MAYTPNPYDATQPVDSVFASTAAAEFRALKLIIAALGVADPFVGDWAVLTGPLAAGKIVGHTGSLWMALVSLADVTLSEPTDVNTDWTDIRGLSMADVLAVTVEKTSATGSAKVPSGTTAERDVTPQPGWTRWNSTLVCNETFNGTDWVPDGWQYFPVESLNTLTGKVFPDVPAWVNEICLHFNIVSSSTTTNTRLRLGHAGGLIATNYTGCSIYDTPAGGTAGTGLTTGIYFYAGVTTVGLYGQVRIKRATGNIWDVSSVLNDQTAGTVTTSGWVDVTAPLTQFELALSSGTFDAGCSVTVSWRA